MNDLLDSNFNNGELTITPQIKEYLYTVAKWAKFLSIVGFVFIGIFILLALFMGTIMANLGDAYTNQFGMMGTGFISVIYIVMSLLYLAPIYFLYQFSSKLKIALQSDDQASLTSSFDFLKRHYKYVGIFMAIILGFYALMLLFVVVFGGMASMM